MAVSLRDEDVAKAIRIRDVSKLVSLFFEITSPPTLRTGFRTETELWDYKADAPHIGRQHANAWAHCAKDILALHNNRGGALLFGIDDNFTFCGATERIDSKLLNDQLRRYLPDTIWVEFHREFIQHDQRYLGLAIVPPVVGPLVRFIADAPETNGRRLFTTGSSAIRENDSTRLLTAAEAEEFTRRSSRLSLGERYYVDEPFNRVPSPDYVSFVVRKELCAAVQTALHDRRTSVTSLVGIGGVGKTALATWAAIQAYEAKEFSFIASCTAKDRELTSAGILGMQPEFTSFETLLNTILDVLRYPEFKQVDTTTREQRVREILEDSGGLLYVDNLETVDDPRIITFLDNLPVGVRALVTSRRMAVRVAAYPITVGQLSESEANEYIRTLDRVPKLSFVKDLRADEIQRLSNACDRVPLSIRWLVGRCGSASQLLREADAAVSTGKRGDELLEFSFRRIFETMTAQEKAVVEILSLFSQPQPSEILLVGSGLKMTDVQDALLGLMDDAIVHRVFDDARNDDCYSLLPITRAFVYGEVSRAGDEARIRSRLGDYFEAKDVRNEADRLVVRAVRQNADSSDSALVDLAIGAIRRGDPGGAEDLLKQAIGRNPGNWRACKELAELYRHHYKRIGDALRYYEQSAAHAPKDARERARIFREWGLLLRDGGQADSSAQATERLETAFAINPRDAITVNALAHL